jgi:hypothetical protein
MAPSTLVQATSAMGRTRREMFVVIFVDECFGDLALIEGLRESNPVSRT